MVVLPIRIPMTGVAEWDGAHTFVDSILGRGFKKRYTLLLSLYIFVFLLFFLLPFLHIPPSSVCQGVLERGSRHGLCIYILEKETQLWLRVVCILLYHRKNLRIEKRRNGIEIMTPKLDPCSRGMKSYI